MVTYRQTSVLISTEAGAALDGLVLERGKSRDATIRELLERYVQAQSARAETALDRRLTHISTVVHYPSCTKGHHLRRESVKLRRLPFRAPEQLLVAAKSHAYRIPGHAQAQAHRDYASRQLSDAVATAISLSARFIEPELEGLPDLWEHRAADGLWHLTRAATLTHTERKDLSTTRDLVEAFLEADRYMWHSTARDRAALRLARRLLVAAEAEYSLAMLSQQGIDFEDEIRYLIDDPSAAGIEYNDDEDIGGVHVLSSNAEGRAASRIWCREREQALHEAGAWITSDEDWTIPASLRLNKPGWSLQHHPQWSVLPWPHGRALPDKVKADVDAGALLRVDHGSRSALWPIAPGRPRPVAGFRDIIAGMRQAMPSATSEQILEACLITESDDDEHEWPLPSLWLDITEAHELRLVSDDEHAGRVAESRDDMARILRAPETRDGDPLTPTQVAGLGIVSGISVTEFIKLADRFGLLHRLRSPTWSWPVTALDDALVLYDGPVLRAFARSRMTAVRRALHWSQNRAWQEAMWWTWETRHLLDEPYRDV